jgi:hypothetical protein
MPTATAEGDAEAELESFRLVYEAVTCDTCGRTYPVTQSCDCGEWMPRPDEHVAMRRAAVADLIELIDTPTVPSTPIGFDEALGTLTSWIADLFVGLNALGTDAADSAGLRRQLESLSDVRARVAANGRRRPWLALRDPLARLIDELFAMTKTYVEAAIAPDPAGAEALQAVAQARLDEAARQIGVFRVRLDWWGLDHTIRLPDFVVAAAAAAYDATGAKNVLDLDRRGMDLYERITGKAAGPTGIGVGLLIDLGLVDRAFDEARVYRVAKLIYRRLDPARKRLAELLNDPGWRADLLQARQVFYEAQLEAETLLRELAGQRRLEARAVIALGGQMTEKVSKTVLGLVLATDPSQALQRTAEYDAVLAVARKKGLADATLGFDPRIRNADAHVDFDVGPDYLVLGRDYKHPWTVTDEALVDVVLASLESCAAIFAAVDCIAAEDHLAAGEDRLRDLPLGERLAIVLATAGVHPGRVTVKADRLEVSGSAHAALALNPLSVIAMLAPHMPAEVRRLVFRLKRSRDNLIADVTLEPLRRYQASDGVEQDVAFVEFLGRATINGRVVFSSRHVRYLLTFYLGQHLEDRLAAAEPIGRLLAATARRLRDAELAESFDAFVALKKAQEGGPPAPPGAKAIFDRLAGYLKPPGPWNDGSGTNLIAA